jgi:hypothetical protein
MTNNTTLHLDDNFTKKLDRYENHVLKKGDKM